jgi:hypothetical protein
MATHVPKYVFYDAPLIPATTRFTHVVDRSSHTAELMAIEVVQETPQQVHDIFLADLGSLRISIGGTLFHNIPITLLSLLGSTSYTGNRLIIKFDFNMFMGRIILFDPQPVVISLETLTTTNVSSVRFLLRRASCSIEERHLLAYGDHKHTVQQITTQSLQSPELTQHFTFHPSMAQFTKGFFIEGTFQDISSVRLTMTDRIGGDLWMYYTGELSVLAQNIGDHYLYVPFNHLADMRSTVPDSYLGSFAYRGSTELTITYNSARSSASIHSMSSTELIYRAGVLQHASTSSWSVISKALNPDRSLCPITYEQISGDYCECDTCHYAFDATPLQNYVRSRPEPLCPTCRSPWTSRTVYQQP